MKAGIVSQYTHDNFGNKLQNYALQQILCGYADAVITLRNQPKAKNLPDYMGKYTPLGEWIWLNRLLGKKKKAAFLAFQKRYLCCSRKVYCLDAKSLKLASADKCDIYCSGSDQVWKPDSGRTGAMHFLGFAEGAQTFSYAASFGVREVPPAREAALRQGLQHIHFLSVREDAGKALVQRLTGRRGIVVVPDPTLLLTRQQWDAVARKPVMAIPKPYLLIYFLGELPPKQRTSIENKAKENNWEILDVMKLSVGPDAFLWLIKQAAYVCTDSFHGSIFAFLYERPLAIWPRQGEPADTGSRLETLVSRFHLEHCQVTGGQLPGNTADYSRGYAALEQERNRARQFLDTVFQEKRTCKDESVSC